MEPADLFQLTAVGDVVTVCNSTYVSLDVKMSALAAASLMELQDLSDSLKFSIDISSCEATKKTLKSSNFVWALLQQLNLDSSFGFAADMS